MGAAYGGINGEEIPGSFLDFPSDHEEFLGNPSMVWRQVKRCPSCAIRRWDGA